MTRRTWLAGYASYNVLTHGKAARIQAKVLTVIFKQMIRLLITLR